MSNAWHLPIDHHHDYREGIHLSLSDLLRLEGEHKTPRIPRYTAAPVEGSARSKQKGRGMDYAESRVYQAGDEIRHIDWRVSARSGKLHTKLFHVERERPVLIVLDQSLPMFFGSRHALKSVVAARLAARAVWRHLHAGDRIGLIRCDDENVTVKRPSSRRADVMSLFNQIVLHHQKQVSVVRERRTPAPSLLKQCWRECRQVATPGTIIYAFCNLMSLDHALHPVMAHLSRHCELHCFALYDALETQLPADDRYAAQDQNGEVIIDRNEKKSREQYHSRFAQQRDDWRVLSQQYRFHFLPVATDDGISLGIAHE